MNTIVIIVIIFLLIILFSSFQEHLEEKPNLGVITLYETDGIVYKSIPTRDIVPVNLKRYSIDLSGLSKDKFVELWGMNIMSSESEFYNSFTSPEFARRANPGNFDFIARVNGGNKIDLLNIVPTKKVFIYTNII